MFQNSDILYCSLLYNVKCMILQSYVTASFIFNEIKSGRIQIILNYSEISKICFSWINKN